MKQKRVYYRFHKISPLGINPSQMNPTYKFNIILPMCLDLFSSGFPTKILHALLTSPMTEQLSRPSHTNSFDKPNHTGRTVHYRPNTYTSTSHYMFNVETPTHKYRVFTKYLRFSECSVFVTMT